MTKEEIQAIRLKRGLSQERFAALLGTTVTTINRWEKGKAKPSRLYKLELIRIRDEHGV